MDKKVALPNHTEFCVCGEYEKVAQGYKAMWYDIVKRADGTVEPVAAEVEYSDEDDSFVLDGLCDGDEALYSIESGEFSDDEVEACGLIDEMNTNIGAICPKCGGFL